MTWFILTMSCIILWGVTDILLKKSLTFSDPLSQFKTFIWIGLVAAPVSVIMAICSDTLLDSVRIVAHNPYIIPVNIFYVIALFFGLLGAKHLDASVVSPLENIDGAIAAIILYLFFLFTGRSNVTDGISVADIIGTVSITAGVILLGIQEQKLSKQEMTLAKDQRKHRLGALALIFPLMYNLVDAVSMVAIGITVSEETEVAIPDIDFFIFECAGFVLVAICIWLYMAIVKKYKYNPFDVEEMVRCGAATGETFGTMAFIFAAGIAVGAANAFAAFFLLAIDI